MKIKFAALALLVAPFTFSYGQSLDVAVVVKAKESTYWNVVRAGTAKAKAEAERDGVKLNLLWDGPQTEDQIDAQKKLVESYIARKVSAIVLAPGNAQALVESVEKAKAASIPVVVIDSPLSSETPVTTVATNNYKAGFLAGKRLAEALGGKGRVALFRYMKGHGSSQPREAGFLDAMKKTPGIQVVSSDMHAGATSAEAEKNAGVLLQKYGAELEGVFAPNLYSTEGMLAALRSAGLAGKVKFVGFDSTDALVEALRKDEMAGLVVQQPFQMGYLGVKSAIAAAQHKELDKEVDTDVKIVTKENVDSKDVQALLNPKA
jgi:ribose transport system substrate-binding protein